MLELLESAAGGVVTLTMHRPDRLNALTPTMVDAMIAALERAEADPDTRAVILTGSGRAFCSGGDVKAMAGSAERTFETRQMLLRHVHRLPLLIHTLAKPVVALVNGPAIGAGLALALACDMRIAGQSARLATGFAKVGLSGDYGGSWFLTQLCGSSEARRLYYFGDMIDADRALAIGAVDEVVADEQLSDAGAVLAARLAAAPPLSMRYMKRNLNAATHASLEEVLELEALHQARVGTSADHREAAQAFVEKRAPRFEGR